MTSTVQITEIEMLFGGANYRITVEYGKGEYLFTYNMADNSVTLKPDDRTFALLPSMLRKAQAICQDYVQIHGRLEIIKRFPLSEFLARAFK